MKSPYTIKFFIIFILIVSSYLNVKAQIVTEEELLGCWTVSRLEFEQSIEDSIELINQTKSYITCFQTNGIFIGKQKVDKGEKIIGTGTYKIVDGKTIYQKRDTQEDIINELGEVLLINDQELVIKADIIIFHFVRIPL